MLLIILLKDHPLVSYISVRINSLPKLSILGTTTVNVSYSLYNILPVMLGPELHTIHQLQSNQRFAQLQHDIQLFYSMSQPMKPSIPNTLSTLSTCATSFRELWTLGSYCLGIPAVYFYVLPELWISQRTSLWVKFHISLFCLTFQQI